MSKTISLRVDDSLYQTLKAHAKAENRSISNFIETATIKYLEEVDYADEFEMENILNNLDLIKRLKKGTEDALNRRGRFV